MSASVPQRGLEGGQGAFQPAEAGELGGSARLLGGQPGGHGLAFGGHKLVHQTFDIEPGSKSGCADRHCNNLSSNPASSGVSGSYSS